MLYEHFIESTLRAAAGVAQEKFGKVVGTIKPDDPNQVLTEADLAIGKLIISEIEKHYPSHNIIDEEAGVVDKKSDYTWVVDPIDGTSNFAKGIPTYGIMVGLLQNSTVIAGGVALPAFDEVIYAEKGQGAFSNNKKISVTNEKNIKSTLVAYGIDGHPEKPELTRQECTILSEVALCFLNLRSSNSVFDAVMLAKGKYAACLNQTTKIWDNVAQQIIIEEAGGMYTDFYGKPMDYSDPLAKSKNNYTFCAAPVEIHKQLQSIIHKSV